jgi:cbb3-type cytochrome oxidase subunit 3
VEPSRARWAGGTLLGVLAVVLLLPVVALASRPENGAGGTLLTRDPARLVLDVGTYLFAVFVVVMLAIIVWALWPRADEELPPLPPRRRRLLSTLLSALLLAVSAMWLAGTGHLRPVRNLALGGGLGGAPPAGAIPGRGAGAAAGFDWLAAGIVLLVLVVGAAVAWWFLRPRRRSGPLSLARLQALLDDAIDDVLGEADPRRAVIAAWARLERVLARHGVPRRDAEAPFEYAARAGAELNARLGVEGGWLAQLAGLFEWARFSTHDVTPGMREEALSGLVAVRDGLRIATP